MDLTDAHSRMVREVFLEMEKRANRRMVESPEYDLQQLMCDFYQDWLRNTEYSVDREKGGKVDILLFKNGKKHTFYELKTYFKANESIRPQPLIADIRKLAMKTVENKNYGKAYLFLAGRKEKLNYSKAPSFVESHKNGDRSFYELPGTSCIRLRPSRKEISSGCTFVMTWEVLVDRLVGTKN